MDDTDLTPLRQAVQAAPDDEAVVGDRGRR